ncbi:MAG: hypothetical protein AW12_02928 [Candidatus Accumulibacter sp. BA-94]|nr:MAG: hypothetical protein AW12_02928 [Candidatus Accumulibacter sp. BA-94]
MLGERNKLRHVGKQGDVAFAENPPQIEAQRRQPVALAKPVHGERMEGKNGGTEQAKERIHGCRTQ